MLLEFDGKIATFNKKYNKCLELYIKHLEDTISYVALGKLNKDKTKPRIMTLEKSLGGNKVKFVINQLIFKSRTNADERIEYIRLIRRTGDTNGLPLELKTFVERIADKLDEYHEYRMKWIDRMNVEKERIRKEEEEKELEAKAKLELEKAKLEEKRAKELEEKAKLDAIPPGKRESEEPEMDQIDEEANNHKKRKKTGKATSASQTSFKRRNLQSLDPHELEKMALESILM